MEMFNLNKLNDVEGKEQFRVEVSNRFAALEDFDTEVEINSAWETIRENVKILAKESLGYFELKKHKPWFDEGCRKLLDQRKEAKLQWLQDPSEMNGDNLKNVRRKASRHFKETYDSVRREVLYNILKEFWVPTKLVRFIKMCLNEACSKVRIGKHLSDSFPIQNGLKQGDALPPLLFNFVLEYAIRINL
jgi:hypothetical protein